MAIQQARNLSMRGAGRNL